MSKKYKVRQNGRFLGHFPGKTPEEAAKKAFVKLDPYYHLDEKGEFHMTKGSQSFTATINQELI